MNPQIITPQPSPEAKIRSRRNSFTEAQLRRTIKAARDIDPGATIEVIIGPATVRLLPKAGSHTPQEPSPAEELLPKQW